MTMVLADLLLLRKELNEKVDRMGRHRERDFFEMQTKRIKVSDGIDEATIAVPKISWRDFDGEYNHYSKQLRQVDAAIQRANWNTQVDVANIDLGDYQPQDVKEN